MSDSNYDTTNAKLRLRTAVAEALLAVLPRVSATGPRMRETQTEVRPDGQVWVKQSAVVWFARKPFVVAFALPMTYFDFSTDDDFAAQVLGDLEVALSTAQEEFAGGAANDVPDDPHAQTTVAVA